MDLYSMTTGLIGQNARRGALMLSMPVSHPDIEEFIKVKTNLDKVTFDKWIGEDINNGFKMLTGLDDESLEIKRGNELDKLYSLTKDEKKG